LLVNSHADGTDSLPFYEGILSRVVHPTNLVAFPEHRTLTVTGAIQSDASPITHVTCIRRNRDGFRRM
jgi:hypothetical protein